jgi:hypothetical protein
MVISARPSHRELQSKLAAVAAGVQSAAKASKTSPVLVAGIISPAALVARPRFDMRGD